jgi:hypothetical protein
VWIADNKQSHGLWGAPVGVGAGNTVDFGGDVVEPGSCLSALLPNSQSWEVLAKDDGKDPRGDCVPVARVAGSGFCKGNATFACPTCCAGVSADLPWPIPGTSEFAGVLK